MKEHGEKKKRRTLSICIRGDQAVLSGDEKTVQFVNENMESITVEELMDVMKPWRMKIPSTRQLSR